jgi:hypothetical protein
VAPIDPARLGTPGAFRHVRQLLLVFGETAQVLLGTATGLQPLAQGELGRPQVPQQRGLGPQLRVACQVVLQAGRLAGLQPARALAAEPGRFERLQPALALGPGGR